jgi:hypothetical protein
MLKNAAFTLIMIQSLLPSAGLPGNAHFVQDDVVVVVTVGELQLALGVDRLPGSAGDDVRASVSAGVATRSVHDPLFVNGAVTAPDRYHDDLVGGPDLGPQREDLPDERLLTRAPKRVPFTPDEQLEELRVASFA